MEAVGEPAATAAAAEAAATQNGVYRKRPTMCSIIAHNAWFKPERYHPRVASLIDWRDMKTTGSVFGAGIAILLAMACFSVISVFANLSLILLTCSIAYRIYKSLMQAIQKTSEGHPFREYLEIDMTLSTENFQNIARVAVAYLIGFIAELRRLFLVEDLLDSIKCAILLWMMTYIGAWFNFMTLVLLAFVSLFTLPLIYENHKESIASCLGLARSKAADLTERIKLAFVGTGK